MSKRAKRTAHPSDAATDDVAAIGDGGNTDGANSGVESDAASAEPVTDPATVAAEQSDIPAPKRGRGRPPGTGTKAKTTSLPLNVTGLEKLLVGIHGGLAILSGRPEWSLDTDMKIFDGKTEAQFLASSVKDVADHYGNGLLDKKTLDWCNLIQCLAIVYGGRVYAIRSTPRVKTAPAPSGVRDAPRTANPQPMHHTPAPVNSFDAVANANDAGVGEIPGIGAIEFPDDHPLKPKLN